MTTKPKTRMPIAQAIARHKAAQAAIDAHSGQIDDEVLARQLFDAENDALEVLAETPCTSDAEFIEKLRYLYAHQARIWGPQNNANDYGCLAIAVACHLGPANA